MGRYLTSTVISARQQLIGELAEVIDNELDGVVATTPEIRWDLATSLADSLLSQNSVSDDYLDAVQELE